MSSSRRKRESREEAKQVRRGQADAEREAFERLPSEQLARIRAAMEEAASAVAELGTYGERAETGDFDAGDAWFGHGIPYAEAVLDELNLLDQVPLNQLKRLFEDAFERQATGRAVPPEG